VDEWGIVREWNPAPDPPGVGPFEHYYCLGDAIAVARALHELLRSADVVSMANWAQTVNVIGAIKTSRTHAVLDPAGHVLALYRARLAGQLVPLSVAGNAPVDAVAAVDGRAGTLSIALINFSPNEEVAVALRFPVGFKAAPATAWRIAGPSLGATNVPGQPEAVTTTRLAEPVPLGAPTALPAHSITVLEFKGNGLAGRGLLIEIKVRQGSGAAPQPQVVIDGQVMRDWDEVAQTLRRLAAIPGKTAEPVTLAPDDKALQGWVLRVLDELNQLKFRSIQFKP